MSSFFTTFLLLLLLQLLLLLASSNVSFISCKDETQVVEFARQSMLQAMTWARGYKTLNGADRESGPTNGPLGDCVELYGDAEARLGRLVSGGGGNVSDDDTLTWLSAALASHVTCLDGMSEKSLFVEAQRAEKLSLDIKQALAVHRARTRKGPKRKGAHFKRHDSNQLGGLASWNAASSKADFVVAQDGSGNFKSINEAVDAVARLGGNRPERVVVYVKSGIYKEKVEIKRDVKNVMFVGDGMDKTIVTGNQNVQDGATTFNSATFGVSGDGFWARDMTFENTAGPQKHQAVAMRVGSDLSVFYRCSFKGYQDTLFVHSQRQFYRDCQIHGTIDFIFGDAAAVFQNCDIYVRKPMEHQSNLITAQGRNDPNENTGISIVNSRVLPAYDFADVKGRFKSYLGRPWKKYSRTVFMKTDLDGLVDGKGWREWEGEFALSTLYYAEYMNTGTGASTSNRVNWPGFHVLRDAVEANQFAVRNFIGGDNWIPVTGVPFWSEL